ncbi:MAG: hypothetical protein FDZ70_08325 [Actinobacteria bacterium]|nr:MAG: hypothetical protein FDZ70_08325 [Actinomycetota bacterium]
MLAFGRERARATVAVVLAAALVLGVAPWSAFAAREGQTTFTTTDADNDGKPEKVEVDWDGDGVVDEVWHDPDEDGVIDSTEAVNTGGDTSRSPRMKPGGRITTAPLAGGGEMIGVDWDGGGRYDDVWWDFNGDGRVDDTDTYATESKILDNTKATRFRGVFVGVNNGLKYAEDDATATAGALAGYGASWSAADQTVLTGGAATPNAIQNAINAAKASSKPGDEFLFYFSGHGGGYHKTRGWRGGVIDQNGDETAILIPESEFGGFDASGMTTPAAGSTTYREYDMNGDGVVDTELWKESDGSVSVQRVNPAPPPDYITIGQDTDGDGKVGASDGGVDVNGDGDKDDKVAVDDTILVAGGQRVTDDQLTQWLSGFPESVTIVVILDSCFSGSFVPDLQRLTDAAGKPLRPGHFEVITAAPADDVATEQGISHGVLTKGLLDGLTMLSPIVTGGHATSLADLCGDNDDRTTTRELFAWACPGAVTYMNTDEDHDGLRNEDGVNDALSVGPALVKPQGDPPSGGPGESGIAHVAIDEDLDGLIDEDGSPDVQSFFDVYDEVAYRQRPVPTHMSIFTGDQALDLTWKGTEASFYTESPMAPGTPLVPGPTLKAVMAQLPHAVEPEPPMGWHYAAEVYDFSVYEVTQSVGLGEIEDVPPAPTMTETRWYTPPVPTYVRWRIPDDGVVPVPARYDDGLGIYEPLPVMSVTHEDGMLTICAQTDSFSKFALLAPVPLREEDITPPEAPVVRSAFVDPSGGGGGGGSIRLAWSRPTDPDFDFTRVMYSDTRYPTDPYDVSSIVMTDSPDNDCDGTADDLDGTRYFSLFACDEDGNWSDAGHATVTRETVGSSDPSLMWAGPWTTLLRSQFEGGSARYTASYATATIEFDGTGVAVICARTTSSGLARIWLDGVHVATIDLYASPNRFREVVYARSDLPAGRHVLSVGCIRGKNRLSAGYNVFVDAFEVYGGGGGGGG